MVAHLTIETFGCISDKAPRNSVGCPDSTTVCTDHQPSSISWQAQLAQPDPAAEDWWCLGLARVVSGSVPLGQGKGRGESASAEGCQDVSVFAVCVHTFYSYTLTGEPEEIACERADATALELAPLVDTAEATACATAEPLPAGYVWNKTLSIHPHTTLGADVMVGLGRSRYGGLCY